MQHTISVLTIYILDILIVSLNIKYPLSKDSRDYDTGIVPRAVHLNSFEHFENISEFKKKF